MAVINVESVARQQYTLLHLESGEQQIALPEPKDLRRFSDRHGCSTFGADDYLGPRLLAVLRAVAPQYFTEEQDFRGFQWKIHLDNVESRVGRFLDETACSSGMHIRVFKERIDAEQAWKRDESYDPGTFGWSDINKEAVAADLVKSIVIEHELACRRVEDDGKGSVICDSIIPVLKGKRNEVYIQQGCRKVLTALLTGKSLEEVERMKGLPVYFGDRKELKMRVFNPTAERVTQAATQLRGLADYMRQNRTDILFYAAQLTAESDRFNMLDILAGKLQEEGADAMKVTSYKGDSHADALRRMDEQVRKLPAPESSLLDYAFSS
jgi:hypothetical protein